MASDNDGLKILLVTTADCSYPAADLAGQSHSSYAPNTYILRVADPVMLPEEFYFHAFEKGFDGIIVMSSGEESPFEGTFKRLSMRLDGLTAKLKERGITYSRLKLCAICSVCSAAFMREVRNMNENLDKLGPVAAELA